MVGFTVSGADCHRGKPPTYVSLNPFGSSVPSIAGKMCLTNETRGDTAEIEFLETARGLDGVVKDAQGQAKAWIRGQSVSCYRLFTPLNHQERGTPKSLPASGPRRLLRSSFGKRTRSDRILNKTLACRRSLSR